MMAMFRLYLASLLVITVALHFNSVSGDAESPEIYDICDGEHYTILEVIASSSPFVIRSPNFGNGSYDNNLDCTLLLQTETEAVVLSFEYRSFNLESAAGCAYDYLCVNGVKFCGDWPVGRTFEYILPENNNSTVHFHTDISVIQPGFDILVTVGPASDQPVNQVAGAGWRASEISLVPTTYFSGMPYRDGCKSQRSSPIIEESTTTIQETTTATQETTTYTQETTTPTQDSTTQQTWDTTTSTAVQDVYYFCNNEQIIDINIESSSFLIRSPHYGPSSLYDNNIFCSLVIRSAADPLVLNLHVEDFQVERNDQCSYDSLCVHGVKFCGDWLNGYTFQYILPKNSNFTMIFKTDSSVIQRGFQIQVFQVSAINQVVYQPTLDVGSSNASLSYTIERYQPGYPYTDRCVPLNPYTPEYYTTPSSVPFTDGPYRTTSSYSTDVPHSGGQLCYSAAYVQELTAAIDNAIDALTTARQLLRENK